MTVSEGSEANSWLRFPFDPVNLSAVQNGVEVLLWICDGMMLTFLPAFLRAMSWHVL